MSELIEKQKVLDALREIATEKFSLDDPYGVYINVLMDVEEKICRLPVVQPNGPDNLVKDSQGLAKDLANDCISRKAAIEKIEKLISNLTYMHTFGADRSIDLIEELPSAQPDKEKISDALYYIYRNKGTSTSAEGVAAIKYYIAEIWREIYGEEGPGWMR